MCDKIHRFSTVTSRNNISCLLVMLRVSQSGWFTVNLMFCRLWVHNCEIVYCWDAKSTITWKTGWPQCPIFKERLWHIKCIKTLCGAYTSRCVWNLRNPVGQKPKDTKDTKDTKAMISPLDIGITEVLRQNLYGKYSTRIRILYPATETSRHSAVWRHMSCLSVLYICSYCGSVL